MGLLLLSSLLIDFFLSRRTKENKKKNLRECGIGKQWGELCGGPSPQIIPQYLAYLVIFSSNALIFPYLGPLLVMIVDTLIIGLEKWF
jgi:hypothetical protein